MTSSLQGGDGGALDLRKLTAARVRLGRCGSALPTGAQLSFLLDHARAREAVWTPLDRDRLAVALAEVGCASLPVHSLAADRGSYLRRPDLGRRLDPADRDRLIAVAKAKHFDVAIVIGDGLSSSAVALNAAPLVEALLPRLGRMGLKVAPAVLAGEARVALGDPIAEALGARLSIMLIGERPGLSAADSLGVYVTYEPKPGTPDSGRNCVSNIRDGGLPIDRAAETVAALIARMIAAGASGVALPDVPETPAIPEG